MNYYIDIKLGINLKISLNRRINHVFIICHKSLVYLQNNKIGISFPEYSDELHNLGTIIRIHSDKKSLERFEKTNLLNTVDDKLKISKILEVPTSCTSFINISRIIPNLKTSKLRRLIKRQNLDENEITSYKQKMFQKGLSEVYLELESTSNQHKYRKYLKFTHYSTMKEGVFNSFGLSKTATVPYF